MIDHDYYSVPRDLTGHPGHDALRRAWSVPPGGRRPNQPPVSQSGDDHIIGNLFIANRERNQAIQAANRPRAIAAHADYLAGASYEALKAKYGLGATALRRHWRAEGLSYAGVGQRRNTQ